VANVLIVDDQQCIRALLSEELICEGYRVTSAGSAESLMGHLRSSRFDVVLLDLYLEGSDGFASLSDIKREYPDLPVLIVTAYDSFADDPRLSEAAGYVVKSSNLDELKEKMTDVLRNQGVGYSKVADRPDVRQVNVVPAL
jgi:DNA-binding response OmpR family regulator